MRVFASQAVEALLAVFLRQLLPPDRPLVPLEKQRLGASPSDRALLCAHYEDRLKARTARRWQSCEQRLFTPLAVSRRCTARGWRW